MKLLIIAALVAAFFASFSSAMTAMDKCKKYHGDTFMAISYFCQKPNIVAPSAYTNAGVSQAQKFSGSTRSGMLTPV
jgi:hypothetical protein